MKRKILLLSASFGDGHRQVANALKEEFASRPDVDVLSIDTFRATNQYTAMWNEKLYEFLTRVWPSLYGLSYDLTANLRLNHWLWRLLAIFSRKAAWKAILNYQPDMVIQLFPDHSLRYLPVNLMKCPKIGVVLTDFAIHSRWFHTGANIYFLPHMSSFQAAKRWFNAEQMWQVTGIPLRKQFSNQHFAPTKTAQTHIVIATGGRGVFSDLPTVIQSIRKCFPDRNVIVMCGRNEAVFRQVKTMSMADPFIHAKGFIEKVAPEFQNALFAIVKAGGVTIAECLASCCPMIFYKPLPGQEKKNAMICEQLGVGRMIRSKSEIDMVLRALNEAQLTEMRNSCVSTAGPNAASLIVNRILELIP